MEKVTLSQAVAAFQRHLNDLMAANRLEPSSYYSYRQAFDRMKERIPDTRAVSTITEAEMQAVIYESRNTRSGLPYAPTTRQRHYACFCRFFDWCCRWKSIINSPMQYIERPTAETVILPIPCREQVVMIHRALPPVYRDAFALFIAQGRRIGEILPNKKRSWRAPRYVPGRNGDYGDMVVYQQKTKKTLTVPLVAETYAVVRPYIQASGVIDFGIGNDEFYYMVTRVNRVIEAEFRGEFPGLNFVPVTPHSLRRFWTEQRIDAGELDRDIAAGLGHSNTQQLYRSYGHIFNRNRVRGMYERSAGA